MRLGLRNAACIPFLRVVFHTSSFHSVLISFVDLSFLSYYGFVESFVALIRQNLSFYHIPPTLALILH